MHVRVWQVVALALFIVLATLLQEQLRCRHWIGSSALLLTVLLLLMTVLLLLLLLLVCAAAGEVAASASYSSAAALALVLPFQWGSPTYSAAAWTTVVAASSERPLEITSDRRLRHRHRRLGHGHRMRMSGGGAASRADNLHHHHHRLHRKTATRTGRRLDAARCERL